MTEDDDYMSDKFLSGLEDVRPSLIQQRSTKRKLELEQKKNELIKKQKEQNVLQSGKLEKEHLEETLKKPLNADNKGFQMLAKMGYKAGDGLGKTNKEKSLLEPIAVTIKNDRCGLGGETAIKELEIKRQQILQQRLLRNLDLSQQTTEEFRKRTIQKSEERSISNHLRCCQVTCENLDRNSQIVTPKIPWFWIDHSVTYREGDNSDSNDSNSDSNEDDEEEIYTDSEKLDVLISYLRTSYYYCHWCGCAYNDLNDLMDNCPGTSKDDH